VEYLWTGGKGARVLKQLEGIRVLESATLFTGDHVGTLLGDLGADVIKIESPFQGDYLRDFLGQITPHHSPAHLQVNKNKRSVTLDLRQAGGREVFWRLLETADVFVDGNAGDALDRLGVGYDEQRKRKPDIVFCQVSGFGHTGAYANVPTHGQMMNALAACTPMEMGDDGLVRPGSPDRAMGGMSSAGEGTANAGIYAAYHVLAGLVRRLGTGQGCFIDVSGTDACIASAWINATYELNDERIADRATMPATGQSAQASAKYQFYETADHKFVLFCAIEHKFWEHFCRAIDRPDLASRSNASAPVDFAAGELELRRELQRIFHTRTLQEWMKIAVEHDVTLGPAPSHLPQLLDDPHLRQREIFYDGEHPGAGPFTYIGQPAVIEGQSYEVWRPAPGLGEHTREVLAELGLTEDQLGQLASKQVI
jgi:crotonobetainyl-CoA:carnitine CoA-transferase CaiB-like acyl-CoA transferase